MAAEETFMRWIGRGLARDRQPEAHEEILAMSESKPSMSTETDGTEARR